jgi:glycine hydroxymethyltransferase
MFHDRRDSGMVVQVDGAPQALAVPDRVLDRSLRDTDPEVFEGISAEPS